MSLFSLPHRILTDIIFRFLDFDSVKALSSTCNKGIELFGAKLLTYDDESHEIQDYRAKKLLYAIVHSDLYFTKPRVVEAVYTELQRATQQNNVSARVRCLQYLLLVIMRRSPEYYQRFCMLVEIMDGDSGKFFSALYANKIGMLELSQNLMGSIKERHFSDQREAIIHQVILMRSSIDELIQSRINELSLNLANDKSHGNYSLPKTLQYIKFLIDVSEVSRNSLKFDFKILMPHLRNTYHVLNLANLLIILLLYQKNTPNYQYEIVVEILSHLIKLSKFLAYDGYAKDHIIYIVTRLHWVVSELLPLLNQEQQGELLFYLSGFSLYNETSNRNIQFLQILSTAYSCALNKALQFRLSKVNERSSEAEILCLFSLVIFYPKLPFNNTNFLISWLIEQTSILELPYNLKLLSMLSPHFNDAHMLVIYDRLCIQLKKHDITNIEELMADMHRTVLTTEQIRSSTDIIQSSVFRLLSLIYLWLDESQCKVMADLIVTVAYGNRFAAEYIPFESPEVDVLSRLCGQLSIIDKAALIKRSMPKMSRHSFFFSGSELCKATPNCLPFLIDQHVFNTLLAMNIDLVQLPLLPYLDISKLSNDQIQLFINKLEMMSSAPEAEYNGLFYVSKDQVLYILILEKYFSREQRIRGANYLTRTLIFGSRDVYNLPIYQIIDFLLSVLGPHEFIDVLYNDVFDLEHPRHEFCNQLTINLDRIFAHDNHTPRAWLAALLPRLSSLDFNYLHPTVMIIAGMIRMNSIVMDSTLLSRFENAVDYLLALPVRYYQYSDLMRTVSKYYDIFTLLRWIKTILQKTHLPKEDSFYEPDHAILDSVRRFLVEFKLSFAAIMAFLNDSNENIVHLGYYYLGRKVPSLSVENLSIFYQFIDRSLDKKVNIPNYIISILAYYQSPIHCQQISMVVIRLLLNCPEDRQNQLISTYNFYKLAKFIMLSCNKETVSQIRHIITNYIRNNYCSQIRNINLLSELSELCDNTSLNISDKSLYAPLVDDSVVESRPLF